VAHSASLLEFVTTAASARKGAKCKSGKLAWVSMRSLDSVDQRIKAFAHPRRRPRVLWQLGERYGLAWGVSVSANGSDDGAVSIA
jgi:hypothetical protein